MPTQTNIYNSRVTDEALEKRFRDTFRSQGGAELVDDLYAQGVIVPVVDFTAAASGQTLSESLQQAWDFSTGHSSLSGTANSTLISNAGFWKIAIQLRFVSSGSAENLTLSISDGISSKVVWEANEYVTGSTTGFTANNELIVFLRSGDTFNESHVFSSSAADIEYRQIATVSGDLVNPSGFTSS